MNTMLTAMILLFAPRICHAYIGPGPGLSGIGSLLAILGAVGFSIFGLIWYPLKRFLRSRKK
jgi:hypothetical protein